MAWIESHQGLARHRKTLRASTLLSVDRHKLIGHLHELWWWALDNVPSDGSLAGLTDDEIAEGASWDDDRRAFVHALIRAGFIDEGDDGLRLHDWYDYAGKLNDRRSAERERSRARRSPEAPSIKESHHDRWSTNGQPPVDQQTTVGTVPNRTQPYPTVPDLTEPETDAPTAHAADAALPSPEPAAPPPAVNSAPKPKGRNLRPLFDAFQALGLKMPPITRQSGPAAGELLKHYTADQIARAWQDVLTHEWGEHWLYENLSFESLNSRNRMGTWERDRDTVRPEPAEASPPAAPRPLPPPKPELPPEEKQLISTWKLVLERIQSETRDQDFRSWFKGTQLVEAGPGGCVIVCEEHQWPWLDKSRAKIARALGVDQELVQFRTQPLPVGASP